MTSFTLNYIFLLIYILTMDLMIKMMYLIIRQNVKYEIVIITKTTTLDFAFVLVF